MCASCVTLSRVCVQVAYVLLVALFGVYKYTSKYVCVPQVAFPSLRCWLVLGKRSSLSRPLRARVETGAGKRNVSRSAQEGMPACLHLAYYRVEYRLRMLVLFSVHVLLFRFGALLPPLPLSHHMQ